MAVAVGRQHQQPVRVGRVLGLQRVRIGQRRRRTTRPLAGVTSWSTAATAAVDAGHQQALAVAATRPAHSAGPAGRRRSSAACRAGSDRPTTGRWLPERSETKASCRPSGAIDRQQVARGRGEQWLDHVHAALARRCAKRDPVQAEVRPALDEGHGPARRRRHRRLRIVEPHRTAPRRCRCRAGTCGSRRRSSTLNNRSGPLGSQSQPRMSARRRLRRSALPPCAGIRQKSPSGALRTNTIHLPSGEIARRRVQIVGIVVVGQLDARRRCPGRARAGPGCRARRPCRRRSGRCRPASSRRSAGCGNRRSPTSCSPRALGVTTRMLQLPARCG